MNTWRLRPLLIGAMLVATLLPSVLVVAWFDRSARQGTQELAGAVLGNVADRVLSEAQEHLDRARSVMDAVASDAVFKSSAEMGQQLLARPDEFERLAFSLTRQVEDLPYLYMGTNTGRFHGVERVAQGMRVGIKAPNETAPRQFYIAASPTDRSTRLPDEAKPYDPRTRPWYQRAAEARGRIFTEVYPSASKKALLITLAQPVYNEQQVLLGVFAIDVPLSTLAEQLQRQKISARGVAFVTDASGMLVASSAGDPTYREEAAALRRVSPQESASPLLRDAAAHVQRSLDARDASLLGTDRSVLRVRAERPDAPPYLLVQREFSSALGAKWRLVIAAPEGDFTADVDRRRTVALWGVAALALLCALAATTFGSRLSRRLKQLSDSAVALGRGEIPSMPVRTRLAEVGQLDRVLRDSAEQLRRNRAQIEQDQWNLQEAHNTLEQRVKERTQELAASREEALEAAKAKAAFLATMSHEIRTPLNGVVGMSSLLAETRLDLEQQDYLSTIRLSSDQLLGVINDILDFSKIESGKLELEQEPLLLRHVVEEACDIAAPRAREKGIELLVDVPIEPNFPLAVRSDATRIRQVLINYINNAVKFTEKGEVAVQLRLLPHATFPQEAKLEFRVKDTGIGIPADRMGALFAAFTQVDASTTRKYGGTGLGLAICKRLAQAMGGDVGVSSQLGVGSEFWFSVVVPVCDADVAASLGQAAPQLALVQGQSVLVLDDNPTNLRILTRQLNNWGVQVKTYEVGTAALQALEQGPLPLAVITDMHMPVMDGIAFAKAVKASPRLASLPLILLSSGVLPVQDPSAALYAARLLKPAREAQLFEAIARCVDPNRVQLVEPLERTESKGKTVLVADDNAVNLKVAVSMLGKLGYESVSASDGRLALEAALAAHARNQPFDLVLMDLNMPNMDGLDATRQLLRALGAGAPPVIALTAAASQEDRERCLQAGMNDYLTKPLQLNALARALDRWIPGELSSQFSTSMNSAAFEAKRQENSRYPDPAPQAPEAAAASDVAPQTDGAAQASSALASPWMDFSRLQEFREFDDADLTLTRGVADVFLLDTPQRVEAVLRDLRLGDLPALARSAHAVKGAASNVGAQRLRELMAHWEELARSGQLSMDADIGSAQLREVWAQTEQALKVWLQS